MDNPYSAPTTLSTMTDIDDCYEPKMLAMSGRIGRLRYLAYYWLTIVLLLLGVGLLGGVAGIIGLSAGTTGGPGSSWLTSGGLGVIMVGAYIFFFVWHFIMMRRRLNDLDMSGWFGLLALVPFINLLLGLYLMFAPGTKGSNRWGPPPSPNPGWMWLAVLFPILVFVLGIVAAIAIPAYQRYRERAVHAHISQPILPRILSQGGLAA